MDYNKLWKILKDMGILDQLPCLLRNLHAGQEATVGTGHGTTDWFQIGKVVYYGFILSPAYLNHMQSTSCKVHHAKYQLDDAQAELQLLGE